MDAMSMNEIELRGQSGLLTIDLDALVNNYRLIARTAAPAKAAAVVKANAYGLDASIVAPALYKAGCRDFFVALFVEALRLKEYLPADARILVLNGLQPGNELACVQGGFTPVLNSLEQVFAWDAAARAAGKTLPAALQIDTGMSRLGLSPQELDRLCADKSLLGGIRLDLIMSHLACADEPDAVHNGEQLASMKKASGHFPGTAFCFANSGGVFLGSRYHGDLVRPGIALYGGAPSIVKPNPMRPVVSLDIAVVQVRTVAAGSFVGYGASYVASQDIRVATVAAGYADGLPRSLSNRGAFYYNGVRLPIIGRVSMDSICVDVTALPEGTLSLGSMLELVGESQTIDQLATDAGTISYEILTSLGDRYRRVYRPVAG
ncbi:alanine racemase [Limoniibacter endophyticus]|uniref:Alanine racemase n=1 Tax=Limoniibacter endophyticus TaxID=1565040 RepID=A0A8J3GHK6_9HYPH|nr:alanine racemase [Limoniibacter endophyticus]GHC72773.1 alanine racemase, catabolic [Limoniibacter endophyticus]